MKSLGVDVFLGEGRFCSPEALEVSGTRLRFHRAVIATGARASLPDIPGLAECGYLTHETLFNLTSQPRRLAVLGGGPIGCELAQAFERLGTRVTVFQRGRQLLGKEDPAAAARVADSLRRDGVEIRLECRIDRIRRHFATGRVHVESGPNATDDADAFDALLVAAGRVPNVGGLGLDRAGVALDRRGAVEVDDFLRTRNPRIFASGDVCSTQQFTHAADFMSRIVVQNALFGGRRRVSRLMIPRVTYTDPEVATVGLTEAQAEAMGTAVTAFVRDLRDVDRARTDDETEGFVKILVARGSDRIIGATLVAKNAGEMIGEISVAMSAGLGLGRLADVVHPYPTIAEAIRQCGDQFKRTRLTPRIRGLLSGWMAWTR